MKRLAAVAVIAASLLLAGCSSNDGVAANVQGGKNYSSDGATFIEAANRGAVVDFTSTTDEGARVDSTQYLGKVTIVNFWYAGCAPCRTEAPLLESVYSEYQAKGVDFLGVNTRDTADVSTGFSAKNSITYPSVLDNDSGNMLLAFAKTVPANAVPTTIVLDEKGRVAARISGEIDDKSLLTNFIDAVLKESA